MNNNETIRKIYIKRYARNNWARTTQNTNVTKDKEKGGTVS